MPVIISFISSIISTLNNSNFFFQSKGRALCHECNAKEKAAAIGKYICFKCHAIIDEGIPLKYKVSLLSAEL
jgi:hypothetical protein